MSASKGRELSDGAPPLVQFEVARVSVHDPGIAPNACIAAQLLAFGARAVDRCDKFARVRLMLHLQFLPLREDGAVRGVPGVCVWGGWGVSIGRVCKEGCRVMMCACVTHLGL